MPGQVRSTFSPRAGAAPAPAGRPQTGGLMQAQAKDPLPMPMPPKETVPGGDAPKAPILGVAPRDNRDLFDAYVRLEPPGREKVFGARETEKELELRFSQLEKDAGRERILFPEKPALTADEQQVTRNLAPIAFAVEPSYVVYRRLYFEEKNAERYGWDFGAVLQPLVSTAYFISDVVWLPKHCASFPHRRFDTNAGLCWPGDPVPYLLYPPEFTVSGSLVETAVIIGLAVAIP